MYVSLICVSLGWVKKPMDLCPSKTCWTEIKIWCVFLIRCSCLFAISGFGSQEGCFSFDHFFKHIKKDSQNKSICHSLSTFQLFLLVTLLFWLKGWWASHQEKNYPVSNPTQWVMNSGLILFCYSILMNATEFYIILMTNLMQMIIWRK